MVTVYMERIFMRGCFLIFCIYLFGCAGQRPPTAEEFNAWRRVRFPEDVIAKVDVGQIRFEGGDGSSQSAAVIIAGASGDRDGVPVEYLWIAQEHGIQGRNWALAGQSVTRPDAKGRRFDVLTIEVAGELAPLTYYFDISEFYGADARRLFGGQ